MSVLLNRQGRREVVAVEVPQGTDGQGKPTYAAPVSVDAIVRRADQRGSAFGQQLGSGDELVNAVTLWIDSQQPVLPQLQARVTLADGFVGIVSACDVVRNLMRGAVDHVRCKLREE